MFCNPVIFEFIFSYSTCNFSSYILKFANLFSGIESLETEDTQECRLEAKAEDKKLFLSSSLDGSTSTLMATLFKFPAIRSNSASSRLMLSPVLSALLISSNFSSASFQLDPLELIFPTKLPIPSLLCNFTLFLCLGLPLSIGDSGFANDVVVKLLFTLLNGDYSHKFPLLGCSLYSFVNSSFSVDSYYVLSIPFESYSSSSSSLIKSSLSNENDSPIFLDRFSF